jgi:hypothetical protein
VGVGVGVGIGVGDGVGVGFTANAIGENARHARASARRRQRCGEGMVSSLIGRFTINFRFSPGGYPCDYRSEMGGEAAGIKRPTPAPEFFEKRSVLKSIPANLSKQ